uniref:Uncharacterized protein n=1 Tax=Arundo donax TaxID=35708 RepID=A0A0A8Y4C0_ARUDO
MPSGRPLMRSAPLTEDRAHHCWLCIPSNRRRASWLRDTGKTSRCMRDPERENE